MRTRQTISMLAAAAFLVSPGAALAQEPAAPPQPVVVTTGEAVILAPPDRAFVTISAESRSRNSGDAQRQNATLMTAVLQKLQQSGVPKEAIRTLGFELAPELELSNGRQIPRGFLARNTIEVYTDDLNRVGEIVDISVGAGATSVGGIRFDLRNRQAVERDALRQAVADARAKADAAAAGAGRAVDRVVRIEESGTPELFRPQMQMRMAAADQASTPIAPSTLEIRANVTLTASLK